LRLLLKLSAAIDAFSEFVGKLGVVLVTLLLAIGVYNVATRYLSRLIGQNLSFNALIEGQWYLYSIIFLLGFSFVLKRNNHVRVDFLYTKFSVRQRAWINLIGTLLFLLPFCFLAIYVTYTPVLASWGLRPNGTWGIWEVSPDPGGLPRAPIKSMIIVAFALLIIQGISEIIKHLAVLIGVVDDEQLTQLEHYEQQTID
jgi:TRAP-type mannitol/chloroaromatic compound transport system permease small subunit